MTFGNATGSAATPSSSGETYNIVVMRGGPVVQQALTPAAIPANSTSEQTFTLAGSGAAGTAVINSAGQVTGVNITAGGSNYWVPPLVTFAGGGPAPSMIQTGTATGLDTPAATAAMPYGSGATGIAVVNSSGQITGVRITNPGSGYLTAPAVSFSGGNWFQPGQIVVGSKPTSQVGLGISGWRIPAPGQVAISFVNFTGSAITPSAGETYSFAAFNDMPPVSGWVQYGATITTPGTSITSSSTSQVAIPLTGVASPDSVVGIQKPTTQSGLVIGGALISATTSNNIYVQFGNVSASGVTPTGAEIYVVTVAKGAPPMPVALFPLYVSAFTSVAANSTSEQLLTVAGASVTPTCPAGSTMMLNYMGAMPTGLSVGGVRMSATTAGVAYVNWINSSSGALTPPAGFYLFGNSPIPGPGVGNWAAVQGSPTQALMGGLANEVQQTLAVEGINRGY
jgi:hypothetical protein